MSLLGRLTERSWETPGLRGAGEPGAYRPAAVAVGLYVYFAVACVLFSLIVAAYLMRMGVHVAMGHETAGDWRPMPEPPLLWVNSAILGASSLAWEAARRAAGNLDGERMLRRAVLGAGLGLLFLAGQLILWRQYQAAGYYMAANPANAFFYLLTAVHGLHLAGGVIACARAVGLFKRSDERDSASSVTLCAIYWHFLLLIWVLLTVLLVLT